MFSYFKKLFPSKNEREIKRYFRAVEKVNVFEPAIKKLTDTELRAKTDEFRKRFQDGETLEGCDAIQTLPARLRAGRAPCEWVAKRG